MKKNNEKIKFRNALISDSSMLSEIEKEIFPEDKVSTDFLKEIEKQNKKIFVCTYENTIKKTTSFVEKIIQSFKPDIKDNKQFVQEEVVIGYIKVWMVLEDMHIEQIGVLENFRGIGLGEKLLLISIKLSLEKGLKKIILECRKSNKEAINLYKKYLFNIISIRKNYYPLDGKREDALCFESPSLIENKFYNNLD